MCTWCWSRPTRAVSPEPSASCTGATPALSTPAAAPLGICGRAGSARWRWTRRIFVTALRYVAFNPVRARLTGRAEDWAWSSTRALIAGRDDHVVKVAPALARVGNFAAFLGEEFDEALSYAALRKAESVGRPIGSADWLAQMEERSGRVLAAQKRGPVARRGATLGGDSQ
jgi:hypothetical protein